ncbi:phage capsid protein [Oceaniglobus trochenteri]|uniref:phage capsid protein n=1 Tax=Oceaniglobus trochenteri TaxID=2763260 RepID=UPI001CFFB2BD|nr:phage capsid protein [Oceaniglobus trochenteri]
MSYAERFDQTKKMEFKDQARLAADHNESKLRATVSEQACEGEQSAPVLYYDSGKATRSEGRVPLNVDTPANRRRRWLKYQPPFKSGEYIDSQDKFRGMSDYQSPLMMHHSGNCKRAMDEDVILEGIFGDAYEGKLGGQVITFPGTQVIDKIVQSGSGTDATGLNLAKLKASRKKFAGHKHDLDREDIFIVVTAEQIDDLSNEIELTSQDYRAEAGPQFSRDGKLTKVWNHVFIEYQNLGTKTEGSDLLQRVPAYLKSCVMLGIWEEQNFDAFPDPSRDMELYMRARFNADCRRLDETGVVEIECLID